MEKAENTLEEIIINASKMGASDIHLSAGSPLMFRIDGELREGSKEPMEPREILSLVTPFLSPEGKAEFEKNRELETALSIPDFGRVRMDLFRQRGTCAAALRILSHSIPTPKELMIPESVLELTAKSRGLILVTGAAGSGKSTMLASMIGVIAEKYKRNIITLEDPIEYLHMHKKSIVSQREIGTDANGFAQGLCSALRQDPDVILVGEMRDLETISTVIKAAETGHLVYSALHTASSVATIDRIIEVFPPYQQQQIRIQLADVLEGIIVKQLLPRLDGKGRAPAYEVMLSNGKIRELIREERTSQIPQVLREERENGMCSMEDAIYDLYIRSEISPATAIHYAPDPAVMAKKVCIYQD